MTDLTEINTALADLRTAAGAVAETKAAAVAAKAAADRLAAETARRFEEMETRMALFPTRTEVLNGAAPAGDTRTAPAAIAEERKAIAGFARTGQWETRSGMNAAVGTDGGMTVLPQLSDSIMRKLHDVSPLGRLARRIDLQEGNRFDQILNADLPGAEWVGESDPRDPQTTPKLQMRSIGLKEISTVVPITQRLLDDSTYDLGGFIAQTITDKFAVAMGAAFVAGEGVLQPEGLTKAPTSDAADGARPFMTFQHINTGVDGAMPVADDDAADKLVDLVHALRAPYRPNARWLMNSATAGSMRKLKDDHGRFLWADSLAEGMPPRLLGHPVELDEQMPAIANGALAIAFGDFAEGYTVVTRTDMRMLRDPYTVRGSVLFYATMRAGGGAVNGEAVKFLRFSAS